MGRINQERSLKFVNFYLMVTDRKTGLNIIIRDKMKKRWQKQWEEERRGQRFLWNLKESGQRELYRRKKRI